MFISSQGSETLGTAFVVGLLIALVSANSGMAALFDALNVVYDEREKRSFGAILRHDFPVHASGDCLHNPCDHGSGRSAADVEVRRSGDDDRIASCDPAMADTSRDHRGAALLVSTAMAQPEGRSLAMGHMGEHPRGGYLDGSLHDFLLVRRHFRQLQPDLRLPWCWHRLHGMAVDLGGDRSSRRRA